MNASWSITLKELKFGVNGQLNAFRALKWDFLALRQPEAERTWGCWPPYLCDPLCDVLRAVLHLGGAEQLHPGSWRRAAFGAPAGWSRTLHKVWVRHEALLDVKWSEKRICLQIKKLKKNKTKNIFPFISCYLSLIYLIFKKRHLADCSSPLNYDIQ